MIRRIGSIAALALAAAAPAAAAHLDLRAHVDPVARTLSASAEVRLESGETLDLRLAEGLRIDAVELDGKPARRLFQRQLAAPRDGKTHRASLRWSGRLAPLDSGMDHRDVLGPLPPMSGEAGALLLSGSGWAPQPLGAFSFTLEVTHPATWRAVAPGGAGRERDAAGERVTRFEFPDASEGIDLALGAWELKERAVALPGGRSVSLRTYLGAANAALAERYLEAGERHLRRYDSLIGPYPYPAFAVAESPLPTGFGMAGFTLLGATVLRLPFIPETSLPHEILHCWWGNGVYVDGRRGNWSEGLTTLLADHDLKEERAPREAAAMRLGWLRDYAALPPGAEQPLAAFRARHGGATSVIGYGKSAMLFLMLRDELGRDTFNAGLRRLWQAQRFRAAGFDEVRAAFEQAAGRPLAGFFAQWTQRTGVADLALADARANGGRLELRVAQGGEPLALTLPLRLRDAGGREFDLRAKLAGSTETLRLPLPPGHHGGGTVTPDPEFRLWRRLAPGEAPPILREALYAARAGLLALGEEDWRAAAHGFARKAVEGQVEALADARTAAQPGRALLLIGPAAAVTQTLRDLGVPPPADLAAGPAQAWSARRAGQPLLVMSAESPQALEQLGRRLPHVGGSSWVVQGHDGALKRGTWPASTPATPLRASP
ncbi:MAG: M1 family peptidase [Betaproteobacteria bacterium]|nr:M1 family peptidase [Betaproteobacteria bacterium]